MKQPENDFTISYSPSTGKEIGKTKLNTKMDLQSAVNRARIAQKDWAKLSIDERKSYLLKICKFIEKNADLISETISKESGKTIFDALSTETLASAIAVSYYAKNAKSILKKKRLNGGSLLTINKRSYVERVPLGVIGIISPWNYPFAIPLHEVIMALIAGNAVILKPATQSLETAKVLEQAVRFSGINNGLFTLLNIPGSVAGDAFIESGINKLFFTGSVPVGKKLMKKASETLLPISLELGGNDAMIVLEDADIFRATSGAVWAGFSNCGQSCAGVERIYVASGIYDEFAKMLKEKVKALRQGVTDNSANKMQSDSGKDLMHNVSADVYDLGSMTTKNQLEIVKRHIEDAKSKGASVFIGGSGEPLPENGFFHPPVILENVNNSMDYMREETFGPVVSIMKFDTIDEAIAMANDSLLGLTASVWTKNSSLGKSVASKIEAGTIMINDHLMSHGLAETPWGGFKESGFGRTHGYIGLESMTIPRTVVCDILPFVKRDMWWHPHNMEMYRGMKAGITFLFGTGISKRAVALVRLASTFLRTFTTR